MLLEEEKKGKRLEELIGKPVYRIRPASFMGDRNYMDPLETTIVPLSVVDGIPIVKIKQKCLFAETYAIRCFADENNDDGWADATAIREAVKKYEKELELEEKE